MLAEYRPGYLARKHAATKVFPFVKEALAELPGRKATATTKGSQTTRAVLDLFGLLPYFDHVQGTDGFPAKPAPDVIFKSLEAFGAAKGDCLFVGIRRQTWKRRGAQGCGLRGYLRLRETRRDGQVGTGLLGG